MALCRTLAGPSQQLNRVVRTSIAAHKTAAAARPSRSCASGTPALAAAATAATTTAARRPARTLATAAAARRPARALATAAARGMEAAPASPAAMALKEEPAEESGWRSLGTPAAELRLEWTLPTGQSFRWRRAGEDEWVGVVGQRAVSGASQALLPAGACWRLQSLGC